MALNETVPVTKDTTQSTKVESVEELKSNLNSSKKKSKSNVSDPSLSVDDLNIPEVTNQTCEFVYNFYEREERVKPCKDSEKNPLNKIARYAILKWSAPKKTEFESRKRVMTKSSSDESSTIQKNSDKIVSEDNFFNPSYVNHTFSNVDSIEQGASDLENYSRMSYDPAESVFKMFKNQIDTISKTGDSSDQNFMVSLGELSDQYSSLADLPKNSLGLRVYGSNGQLVDDDDLLRSITDNLSLTMKINSKVIPDIFVDSTLKKNDETLRALRAAHAKTLSNKNAPEGLIIKPVYNDTNKTSAANLTNPVSFIGYIVDRYVASQSGFLKDKTVYIEDPVQTSFVDKTVLYGYTYVYSIRVIASVKLLTYNDSKTEVNMSTVYASSRPVSVPIECFEYTPPPEPNDIRFVYDYQRNRLTILWDTPVNPQRDIKQFQVFRRKSIREPFELIAQYGFDTTINEQVSGGRYKTGERVDANGIENMLQEDLYLVHIQDKTLDKSYPVRMHIDEDFVVDTEFSVSSEYIYAICSVDAHGMISNYSSQHKVTFDPYKNRLVTSVICDAGSPRPYPNMNLRMDAFKDIISVAGDDSRKLDVFFTPEYLRVRDERNVKYKIVEAQTTTNKNPFYVFQMINLDNQKTKILKINVKDPQNLTDEFNGIKQVVEWNTNLGKKLL